MTLDTPAALKEGVTGPVRLSTLGCATLTHIFGLSHVRAANTASASLVSGPWRALPVCWPARGGSGGLSGWCRCVVQVGGSVGHAA